MSILASELRINNWSRNKKAPAKGLPESGGGSLSGGVTHLYDFSAVCFSQSPLALMLAAVKSAHPHRLVAG